MKMSTKQVIVIEPSHFMRKLLETHLQIEGHSGVTFATYAEALRTLPQLQERAYDLAFVAVHAHEPDSQRLLYALRLRYPSMVMAVMLTKQESAQRAIQKAVQATNAVTFILPFLIQDALALCNSERFSQAQGEPTT